MNPTAKYRLKWFLYIIVMWIVVVSLTPVYEYLFLSNYPDVLETEPMSSYDFKINLFAAMIWGFLGALVFSFTELFYLSSRLERKPFYQVVLIKVVIYTALLILLNVIISYLYNLLTLGKGWNDPEIMQEVGTFITGYSFWHPLLPFLGLVLITLFIMQINQRFSRGELLNLVRGRYFSPKEEVRIFMFLDVKDSTGLAERLGHVFFFEFLNDIFHDITDTILLHQGDIYDYVGDEVIITWTVKEGTRNNNCTRFFEEITKVIDRKAEYYNQKYGEKPRFKAGLHMGQVTIGEVGKIKKQITYSGDVMNTTSRIQSICNEYDESLIVSHQVLEYLDSKELNLRQLGEVRLKGKSKQVKIAAVRI